MSSLAIHTEGKGDYAGNVSKSVISTKPFNQEFYTYTVSTNSQFQKVGTLAYVTSDSAKTPASRILHLTGRKLYPTINPGVTTFMVSVYDPISFLTGFISPASSTFAKYDQLLPNFFDNGPSLNGSSIPPLGGQGGKLTLADDRGAQAVTAGSSYNAKDAAVGSIAITGAGTSIITTSAARAGSRVFLTRTAAAGSLTDAYITAQIDGSFSIVTVGAGGSFNWMVVN